MAPEVTMTLPRPGRGAAQSVHQVGHALDVEAVASGRQQVVPNLATMRRQVN